MKDKHSGVTDTNNEANAVRDATKLASRAKEPRMKVLKNNINKSVYLMLSPPRGFSY